MSATNTDRLVVDLLDPALYQRNPHDVWDWMRANEPVYRDDRNGLWGVTRHADLIDVERRSTVFPSANSYRVIPAYDEANMIAQDDPRHRQQRMLVQQEFTRAAVATKRAPDIAALTSELIDAVIDVDQIYAERFYFVVEVLSKGNRPELLAGSDRPIVLAAKIDFYKLHDSCRGVLIVHQDRVAADLYLRDRGWTVSTLCGPSDRLVIPDIGDIGALSELYRDTPLAPRA